jgi:hypothetical protein
MGGPVRAVQNIVSPPRRPAPAPAPAAAPAAPAPAPAPAAAAAETPAPTSVPMVGLGASGEQPGSSILRSRRSGRFTTQLSEGNAQPMVGSKQLLGQ